MLSLGVAKGAPVVPTSLTSTSGRRGRGRTSRVGGFPPAGLEDDQVLRCSYFCAQSRARCA